MGASAAFCLTNGYDTGNSANSFADVVLYITNQTPVVISSSTRGSPTTRTYSTSGSNLQLAMSSGTYNVAVTSMEQAC